MSDCTNTSVVSLYKKLAIWCPMLGPDANTGATLTRFLDLYDMSSSSTVLIVMKRSQGKYSTVGKLILETDHYIFKSIDALPWSLILHTVMFRNPTCKFNIWNLSIWTTRTNLCFWMQYREVWAGYWRWHLSASAFLSLASQTKLIWRNSSNNIGHSKRSFPQTF